MKFELLSSAFIFGSIIPDKFTDIKNQTNISSPLNWINSPKNSVSFAILADDLGTQFNLIIRWIIYNIPPVFNKLEKSIWLYRSKSYFWKT